MMLPSFHSTLSDRHGSEKTKRRARKEKAVKLIQRMWWTHLRKRLFKLLKHTIRAAEYCISYDILKRVSPLEAELLKEPTIQGKVRFRFAGSDFPPFIVFKIFCNSRGQGNQYISGKRVITSSEAAVDACKLMGYRKYYNQMLIDELNYKKYRITDEMDVATIKDYVQYTSHLDETPAYFGGKHNYWRKLSLENFPRTMIIYDIMDYAQSGKLSSRLREELPFLLLRPQNEETCHAQLMAVCEIRAPTPCLTTASFSRLVQKQVHRPTERRSYQARQKIAKMKKAYKDEKEKVEQKKDIASNHSQAALSLHEGPSNLSLFSDEDWEQEAVKLYDWSRSLKAEDIGKD
ncbi:uncharacterized protein CXorf58 homolog [Hemicordylus capensis]|uniref:uncharacterized protein CXorf58 homolog n=1 Tax=Hemicordylus capensis TaxID=884348 RepID=UPI00230457D9|nr:uncharacterized protein CXorf58 homolog [Hemicordylus capensis]